MMRAPSFTRSSLAACLFLSACGGRVVVDGMGDSGGVGGGSSSSTSTSTTSSSVTTSTATGTPIKQCGGKAGVPCAAGEFCDFTPDNACGGFDATGACAPIPTTCDGDCPGVCGCDGQFYCNECDAHSAGIDITPDQSCLPPTDMPVYSATVLATGAPRFAIMKVYPIADVCFSVVLVGAGGGGEPFTIDTPKGWKVEAVRAIQGAKYCDPGADPWPPPEFTVTATDAAGVITFKTEGPGFNFPCQADIHAKLGFPAGSPWVPPQEAMDVDAVPVQGACP